MNTTPHPSDRRRYFKAGLASVTCFAMDLHDLMIILFVAATIGPLLVPAESETLQLTFVYASFAVTLLMRPAGSVIFGNLADKRGRKNTLIMAVGGLGVATALMGTVPTYATAGIVAPILFVALRLVQGIFVGGIVASTHTLGTETVPNRYRGLMSGLIAGGGAGGGALFASCTYFIVSNSLTAEQFAAFGWRMMFFAGLLTTAICLVILHFTDESPVWSEQHENISQSYSPVRHLFSDYRRVFVASTLIVAGGASMYYLTVGFLPTFFSVNIGLDQGLSSGVLVIANVCVIIGGIIGGSLSDRIGRRRAFLTLGIPAFLCIPVMYLVMSTLSPDRIVVIVVLSATMTFFAMGAAAPVTIFLNERFPTRLRAIGTALCWNVGYAAGGMMPTLVTAMSPTVDDIPSRLVLVTFATAALFLIAVTVAPETSRFGLTSKATEGDTKRANSPVT